MATSPWNGALGNTQPPASARLCAELRSSHFSFFEVKEADPAPCRRSSRASLSHTARSLHRPPKHTHPSPHLKVIQQRLGQQHAVQLVLHLLQEEHKESEPRVWSDTENNCLSDILLWRDFLIFNQHSPASKRERRAFETGHSTVLEPFVKPGLLPPGTKFF